MGMDLWKRFGVIPQSVDFSTAFQNYVCKTIDEDVEFSRKFVGSSIIYSDLNNGSEFCEILKASLPQSLELSKDAQVP